MRRAHIALFNCACPIVVALERYGINAGTSLALSGDLLIAGEGAFLQISPTPASVVNTRPFQGVDQCDGIGRPVSPHRPPTVAPLQSVSHPAATVAPIATEKSSLPRSSRLGFQ